MEFFQKLIRNNAHVIIEFSQEERFRNASNFLTGKYRVYFWTNENDPLGKNN